MANESTTTSIAPEQGILTPPHTIRGILARLGPGLIIAASIVGSGELIMTTKTGAEAGFTLLWLIIFGCVMKSFVQVELGRYTIAEGLTTMEAMNQIQPKFGVSWLVWYWLFMFLSSLAQLGGICGGVGESLAMIFPIHGDFIGHIAAGTTPPHVEGLHDLTFDKVWQVICSDEGIYSCVIAAATSVLLVVGRYALIQNVSTILVAGFTAVTVFNLGALPYFSNVDLSWSRIWEGLSFHLPESRPGHNAMATALAAFGIIGVGASELIAYPYWCLEKGYARFTGLRDNSPQWAERALGWLRVMRWDAWCSMVIYTFATIAFYLLGASVLHSRGEVPKGPRMIYVLSMMYEDVFGDWGKYVFLVGAFAVLYSTFFVAIAGHTRVVADGLRAFGLGAKSEGARQWWIKLFSGLFPIISLFCYLVVKDPVGLVALSGLMQAMMLPMLGGVSIYFRYRRCDRRIMPGMLWDAMLWLSFAGLLVAGIWAAYENIFRMFGGSAA